MIDVDTPIDYPQLYAQCMQLLAEGERHWFTSEEVKDIEHRNRDYHRHRPVEELFFRHYRLPREGETPTLLSAAHIYEHLAHCDARLMKIVCAQNFGKVLRGLGVVRSEHHDKRVYAVIPMEGRGKREEGRGKSEWRTLAYMDYRTQCPPLVLCQSLPYP